MQHLSTFLTSLSIVSFHELVIGGLFLWLSVWFYRLTFHPLSKFKGPKIAACSSIWFLYWIARGQFSHECERLYEKYDTNALRVAPNQVLFRSPESLKQIVGRNDVYKGPFSTRILGFHATNISNIKDPAVHKRKRKLMNPGFSAVTLSKQERTSIMPLVEKFVDIVEDTHGESFDISSYFDCVTTDIIGKLSFGADLAMLDNPKSHPFLHVLPDAFRISAIAQCIPEIYSILDFIVRSGPRFMLSKSLRGVTEFAAKHLRQREERDKLDFNADCDDIMSVILDGSEKIDDQNFKLGPHEILGEATVLVAGGGDTVATALTMTMWNLGQCPSILKELQSQVRAAFKDYSMIDSKTVAAAVPLVDAVLKESMRLTPVLPGPFWRRSDIDITVEDIVIPAGTDVGVQRLSLYHNKRAFHDAERFIPQRWLGDMGDNLEASQAFGIGLHTCPGRYLAMVEMRLILTKLLWKFDWEFITAEYNNPEYLVVYRAPLLVKAKSLNSHQ